MEYLENLTIIDYVIVMIGLLFSFFIYSIQRSKQRLVRRLRECSSIEKKKQTMETFKEILNFYFEMEFELKYRLDFETKVLVKNYKLTEEDINDTIKDISISIFKRLGELEKLRLLRVLNTEDEDELVDLIVRFVKVNTITWLMENKLITKIN